MAMLAEGSKCGDDAGWFDVQAYSTRARWEGPDLADAGLDGFEKLQAAVDCANSEQYTDCYEVVVTAWGNHKDHEPGASVYCRFNRPTTLACNEASVVAGQAAVTAHTGALKLDGGPQLQLWHLLVSLREWSVASGLDFDEVMKDVDTQVLSGNLNMPAAERQLRAPMTRGGRPHQGLAASGGRACAEPQVAVMAVGMGVSATS